ncbi:MAG: metallophosphoesterase [Deltaproteobacteria bacterium]|nr:metallophosphoesterase [Deltaproteobacteria bacterium]
MSKSISAMLSIIMMLFLFGCATTCGNESASGAARIQVTRADAMDKTYHHLVVLGDPHLPGKNIEAKEHVIQNINSWDDVDMVIAVGDICEDRGTDEEYAAAGKFFGKLNKPLYPIAGNHDYIYEDTLNPNGNRVRARPYSSQAKLDRFKESFRLPTIYYDMTVGSYLLVFLSTDQPDTLTRISEKQLEWLSTELDKNSKTPTLIFFHAPLKGTLRDYSSRANTPDYIAQPSAKIHKILMKNPQVFLWVSGHTHTSPKEESYAASINVYENRITNIHNADMNRETIWTNSLFMYPDKITIKTYDHQSGAWLPSLERTLVPPSL